MKQNYEEELTPEIREKMKKNLVIVSIFSVVMVFAGLTSAYIVSMGDSFWLKTSLPTPFWISTALIALSSLTFILAVRSAKKNKTKRLKLFITATMLLGIGFVIFQFKGYQALINDGIHPVNNRIFVNEGKYGDYFLLKHKGNYLEIDGNDYFLKGKKATQEEKQVISQFAAQFIQADEKGALNNIQDYGDKFFLLYENEPLTYLNNNFILPNGESLEEHQLYRLKMFAYHLKDGRGDFFAKGELGKDFNIYYKGRKLECNNRNLYLGDRKLDGYLMTSAMDSADTASSFLFIITILHLAHIVITLLFMLKTVRNSYTGKYNNKDTIGLRVTGIFWHFLGVLWLYLLLFLLFIH